MQTLDTPKKIWIKISATLSRENANRVEWTYRQLGVSKKYLLDRAVTEFFDNHPEYRPSQN